MTRAWIALGVSGLLGVGISIASLAGIPFEGDLDGVPDLMDNCLLVPNGPELATGFCDSQEDGDMDGYGNPCDTDTNNDGGTGLDDVGDTLDQVILGGNDPKYDINCDGGIGLDDLGRIFDDVVSGVPPGPSGLACAGSIPCP